MGRERFDEQDTLLTFQEAAEFLRVSKATMYRWLASGQLVGYKVGRSWRFYRRDLHAFVSAQGSSGAGSVSAPREHVPASQDPE